MTAPTTTDVRAISWRTGSRNFGVWHVQADDSKTACGVTVNSRSALSATRVPLREVRGHTCDNCMRELRRAVMRVS
jgi:hypothetical protein